MQTKYLLPCSCGEKIAVEPRQAGQTIECRCGKTLEVPTLRTMTALEPAVPEPVPAVKTTAWEIRQGMALIGAAIALTAVILAVVLVCNRPKPPPGDPSAEFIRRQTQALTPLQVWRVWHSLRQVGPDPRRPRENPAMVEERFRYRLWLATVLVIAGLGCALCVASATDILPVFSQRHGRHGRGTR